MFQFQFFLERIFFFAGFSIIFSFCLHWLFVRVGLMIIYGIYVSFGGREGSGCFLYNLDGDVGWFVFGYWHEFISFGSFFRFVLDISLSWNRVGLFSSHHFLCACVCVCYVRLRFILCGIDNWIVWLVVFLCLGINDSTV